jgi:hypothetical protein
MGDLVAPEIEEILESRVPKERGVVLAYLAMLDLPADLGPLDHRDLMDRMELVVTGETQAQGEAKVTLEMLVMLDQRETRETMDLQVGLVTAG